MFETTIVPRVSETDGMGHINNTVVPIWFEAGRQGIFEILTPNLSFKEWKCVVVNLNVDYMKEILFGKNVIIHTYIKEIKNSSFIVEEELYQEGHLCSKGTATYVYFNLETRRSEPIQNEIREKFKNHLRNQ